MYVAFYVLDIRQNTVKTGCSQNIRYKVSRYNDTTQPKFTIYLHQWQLPLFKPELFTATVWLMCSSHKVMKYQLPGQERTVESDFLCKIGCLKHSSLSRGHGFLFITYCQNAADH